MTSCRQVDAIERHGIIHFSTERNFLGEEPAKSAIQDVVSLSSA